jgi:hypothetical protein
MSARQAAKASFGLTVTLIPNASRQLTSIIEQKMSLLVGTHSIDPAAAPNDPDSGSRRRLSC